MHVTVNAQGLAAALKNNLAQKRSPLMVFEHVLLIATSSPDELRIISRDGSQELEVVLPAERVNEPGQVACHAEKLQSAVTGLAGPATVKSQASAGQYTTTLQQGRRRFQIASLSAEAFPSGRAMGAETTATACPAALAEAIATVQYAAGKNDVRHMMNGVHLNKGDVVATDGHRLACASINADLPPLTIPRDSLKNTIAALMEEGAAVRYSDNALEVVYDNGRYRTQLLDGKYVDYQRVMSVPQNGSSASANAANVLPALQRLRSFVAIGTQLLTCQVSNTLLTLTAGNGETSDEAEASCAGDFPMVNLNLGYLSDVMHAISGDFTWFNPGTDQAQFLWTGNQDVIHVVMPMRV